MRDHDGNTASLSVQDNSDMIHGKPRRSNTELVTHKVVVTGQTQDTLLDLNELTQSKVISTFDM